MKQRGKNRLAVSLIPGARFLYRLRPKFFCFFQRHFSFMLYNARTALKNRAVIFRFWSLKGCGAMGIIYRHEWKYEVNWADVLALRRRLSAVASADPHAAGGKYFIRSLYFDTLSDTALREKLDGVSRREKFRLRYYNQDTSLIRLEKKSKWNNLGHKEMEVLSPEEAQAIVDGDRAWEPGVDRPLAWELRRKMRTQGLRPKTIVDYTREPFVYAPGHVRVTLDYNIRTGMLCTDFLNPDCVTIPAGDAPVILEVKWDEFLPAIIRDAVQLPGRREGAFSKYAACRIYG